MVDSLMIPNIHPQLIPALTAVTQVPKTGAIGVIEFYSVASAINAADVIAKAAQVTLMEVRIGFAIGGKGFVSFTGEVGAVRAAIAAAEKSSELYVHSTVIPKPSPRLYETLL
jgi:microcompartment protein CcmL/EutN